MLTAEGRPEQLVRARALGAKAWLLKPVVADRLLSVVNKLLG
jgi:DNA-binding response OmpR family regulator